MRHPQENVCHLCKVYEAEVANHPTWKFSIAVNADQEKQLHEDIWMGRKLITLGRVVAETDCDVARAMADTCYA